MTCMREILPIRRHNGPMIRNVAVVVLDGFEPFELGVVCEVFGTDRTAEGLPGYDFAVVAGEPGPLRSPWASPWIPRSAWNAWKRPTWWPCRPSPTATPGCSRELPRAAAGGAAARRRPGRACAQRLHRRVRAGGGRAAGWPPLHDALAERVGARPLLPGRRASTPRCSTWTTTRSSPAPAPPPASTPASTWSAGSTGSKVANAIARRMVVPPHRDGGRRNTSTGRCPPVAADIAGRGHPLDGGPPRPAGHRRASWPPGRTCHRARSPGGSSSRDGTTPQRWLTGQRILLAQQMLEETGETVDAVAERAGFGNATALRHHFRAGGTRPARLPARVPPGRRRPRALMPQRVPRRWWMSILVRSVNLRLTFAAWST